MLLTVGEFRSRTETALPRLIEELQVLTGRSGAEEADAWRASLPKLAGALAAPKLSPLHVYFAGAGSLALEYQLPAASSWCDVVLLGHDGANPQAVVIELKNWETWGDRPGPYEGLMIRQGSIVLHPSDQVRGYTEYCRRFHSAVQEHGAGVSGCVLFTRDYFPGPYSEPPNDVLTRDFPCFTAAPDVVREALPRYLTQRVTVPSEPFAEAFVKGTYRQDRGFIRQIGAQILADGSSPFELLDNQRRAFALVRARIEEALFSRKGLQKQVLFIEGPPGSGKSVLAAKLWATLVSDDRLPEGSAVVTTTSTSQTSNWTGLFQKAGKSAAAGGVVKKAANYVPISTQTLGRLRKRHGADFLSEAGSWRENVRLLRNLGERFQDGALDDKFLISIVDEAHALINPERPEGRGQFGFATTLGPPAWHIIRASKVSIFLLDAEQGFRDRENTTLDEIREWARELGATVTEPISLAGAQFRCAGSKEYVEWIEMLLAGEKPGRARSLAREWRKVLDFSICHSPTGLEARLRERMENGRTGRLLASFARPWKTRDAANPHELPPQMQDFNIGYRENGRRRSWSRIWNFVPRSGTDYTWFVQAPAGAPMHDDPLCEVGCPYAVRGFDFDYVGVLWLSDLKRREGRWVADPDHVHETGLNRSVALARREPPDRHARERLRAAIARAYRILLTRGIYGVHVWFEDEETRAYVEEYLGPSR